MDCKKPNGDYILFFKSGYSLEQYALKHLIELSIKYNSKIVSLDFIELPEYTFFYQNSLTIKHDLTTIKLYNYKDYIKNLNTIDSHEFEKTCVLWNKLIHKSILNDYIFPEDTFYLSYENLKKLYSKTNKIIESNVYLVNKFLIDDHYNSISFDYNELEHITFLQDILTELKKEKNFIGVKNISINILKLLYCIRKKLAFYYLDIYDKEEQQLNIDKKFNSIKNFLNKKFPNHKNEYQQIIDNYSYLYKREKFKEKYACIFPQSASEDEKISYEFYLKFLEEEKSQNSEEKINNTQ